MPILIAGSSTPNASCKCGWKFPKEIVLNPAGMLKGLLTSPTLSIKTFVESIQVACPSCGSLSPCGDAKIVR